MADEKMIDRAEHVLYKTYNRFPVVFDHGKGITLWDTEGNEYLDFGAGIVMKKRTGDVIATGETLAVVYSKSREKCQSAADFLQKAITIEAAPLTEQTPLILKTIRQEG